MLNRLKALFPDLGAGSDVVPSGSHAHGELQLAVAALLIEAARMDGEFGADERDVIRRAITERLEIADADALIAEAEQMAAEAGEYWSFARVAKNSFDYDERVELIEMLWEVAYADGELHDYEANLLRRITGLLYVSDRDSGAARKRVLERFGLAKD
ncbi:MAG: TerB family tellurite resistance protein [Alphaproteobacteria bacterium]|nr:TerB family tellurite resistance protein [Alphaproteobacteria bacterium]